MLHSVFAKTLHDVRGQILGWGSGLAVLGFVTVLVFPSLQGIPELQTLLRNLPRPLQALMGGVSRVSVLEGFLQMKLFEPMPLLLSVFAIAQGSSTIAGEEERGTLDLLLALPVTRWRVASEKLAALVVAIVAMCLMMAVGLVAGILVTGVEADLLRIVVASLNVAPPVLVIAAVALLGSCIFHRHRHAAMPAIVLTVFAYFLNALGLVVRDLEPWRKLSLFYYQSLSVPLTGGVRLDYVALLLGKAVLVWAVSLYAFQRKDLMV